MFLIKGMAFTQAEVGIVNKIIGIWLTIFGALLAGADFVKGSRFLQGGGTSDMTILRRLGNWGFTFGVRVLFGGSFSDLCYGYNAFWSKVLHYLELDADGFEVETMMNVRALSKGLRVAEVPSFEADRVHGVSNLRTFPDGWRVLKTIVGEWLKLRVVRMSVSATTGRLFCTRSPPYELK